MTFAETKRNENIGNLLVRSAFQTMHLCPFICNAEKLSGPKRSIEITNHFTCTSANVVYCMTWALFAKSYTSARKIPEKLSAIHCNKTSFQRPALLSGCNQQLVFPGVSLVCFVPLMPLPNDRNMPTQYIATLLGAPCCVRLATLLRHVTMCWVLLTQI